MKQLRRIRYIIEPKSVFHHPPKEFYMVKHSIANEIRAISLTIYEAIG